MRNILLLLIIMFYASPASAQYCGLSGFAAMADTFPCDRYIAITNSAPYPAMAVLYGSFGKNVSCIQSFLDSNKHRPHLLQIHLTNEACRRNSNCVDSDFLPLMNVVDYTDLLTRNDPAIIASIETLLHEVYETVLWGRLNENTTVILSTGLEHNFSNIAAINLTAIINRIWHTPMSINPLKGKEFTDGEFLEKHGSRPGAKAPCIVNEDGATHSVSQSRKFLLNTDQCMARFLWRAKHQGRPNNKWIPYHLRQYIIPDTDLAALSALLKTCH